MRALTVIGNWKMNGSFSTNTQWMEAVGEGMQRGMPAGRRFGVCVPFPYLHQCAQYLTSSQLFLGAQDVSAHESGAFTGEVSASMLQEMGTRFVIVGHSERRMQYGEANETIALKAGCALDHEITPIICVGETADERNSGRAIEVVRRQVASQVSTLQDRLVDCLIAYEPIWAIGTGKVASAQMAQDMHRAIRLQLAEFDDDVASHIGIIYGGSVRADNATELFAMPDIDGGLVGGASLDAQEFLSICRS
ncbi:TpiA Triosephosphate isomerase [Burkholderiaceae bacterium]